mmetsp:Transcript_7431/g.20113  ORF Transcript_7431/g.20113 Transcript_7431/m.20113 type:complete len:245 (+) Transcript_7431:420-1154(+)
MNNRSRHLRGRLQTMNAIGCKAPRTRVTLCAQVADAIRQKGPWWHRSKLQGDDGSLRDDARLSVCIVLEHVCIYRDHLRAAVEVLQSSTPRRRGKLRLQRLTRLVAQRHHRILVRKRRRAREVLDKPSLQLRRMALAVCAGCRLGVQCEVHIAGKQRDVERPCTARAAQHGRRQYRYTLPLVGHLAIQVEAAEAEVARPRQPYDCSRHALCRLGVVAVVEGLRVQCLCSDLAHALMTDMQGKEC